jgi:hypothetical protein
MEDNDYLAHLSAIKGIIEDRTKFKALSGLSGVIAGVFALIGAFLAHQIIYNSPTVVYQDMRYFDYSEQVNKLLLLALGTLVCAVTTGIYFSARNARQKGTKLWTSAAVKVAVNLSIPLITGGVFVLALLWRGYFGLVASSCLLFYGLALINAANYTFSDIRALGFTMLGTAFFALFFPGYGLYFWAFGFGVLHILYGTIMYFKYEK